MGRERARSREDVGTLVPVRVRVVGSGAGGVFEIAMAGGVVVRVDRDVDLQVLDRVLAALR